MDEGLVKPQFHAREHLNTSLWMQALRDNHEKTSMAFDNGFYGLKTDTPSKYQHHYLEAYNPISERDFDHKTDIIKEGLDMFAKTFGFHSSSFIACNYVWPSEIENKLSKQEVKVIQGQRNQVSPNIYNGERKMKKHYTGQKNDHGQVYSIRNCWFEPTVNQKVDEVWDCLEDIEIAFRWKKPAVISSHRINYVSGMDKKNRNQNLKQLNKLLSNIIKTWSDVEFMSTDQLGKVMFR